MYYAPALAVQLVKLQQLLHLTVVSSGVGVYHLLWGASVVHVVAEVVQHHVAVEHSCVFLQCLFCKAVVVVPRLHVAHYRLHVAVGRDASHLLVVREHVYDILGGESKHLVKLGLYGYVPPHVVAACHIIERYGAYAHHEYALKVSLELLEHVAVEPIGMCYGMIHLLSVLVEYYVCEVVVLINDEIKFEVVAFGSIKYHL